MKFKLILTFYNYFFNPWKLQGLSLRGHTWKSGLYSRHHQRNLLPLNLRYFIYAYF